MYLLLKVMIRNTLCSNCITRSRQRYKDSSSTCSLQLNPQGEKINPTKAPNATTFIAMPSSTSKPTTTSFSHNFFTLLFLLVLLVAFFPSLFHYISTLPLAYLYSASQSSATPPPPAPTMSWSQKQFTLPPRSRGSYLITDHVVKEIPEIRNYKVGLLNLFVQHTSCALSLNENWDDDVRADMSDALDRIAPEAGPKGEELYRHSAEGSDDMPVGYIETFYNRWGKC